MPAPTTLLFDVDGTLVQGETAIEDQLTNAFAAVGVEPFCTVEELCAVLPDVKGTTFGELKVACVRAVATEKGHSTAAEQVAQAIELPDAAAVEPVDGAVEVLGILHERGYTLGIVTNGPEALQRAKLRQVALNDLFTTVVFGRPERGLKPAVAPFETALVDLASAPAETVAIGDSYTADIEPAHELGLTTVWLSRSSPAIQAAPKADHVIHSLRALLVEPWRQ